MQPEKLSRHFIYFITTWHSKGEGWSPLMCGGTPDLNATISQLSCYLARIALPGGAVENSETL